MASALRTSEDLDDVRPAGTVERYPDTGLRVIRVEDVGAVRGRGHPTADSVGGIAAKCEVLCPRLPLVAGRGKSVLRARMWLAWQDVIQSADVRHLCSMELRRSCQAFDFVQWRKAGTLSLRVDPRHYRR